MRIEDNEVKISLTVREAQSLATVLASINKSIREHRQIRLVDLPRGMLDDCVHIESDLRNLVHFDIDRKGH